MSRKQIITVLIVAAGGLALAVWFKMQRPSAAPPAEESTPTVVSVQVGQLSRATLRGYVEGFGTVAPAPATEQQPAAAARIASPVAGLVTEVKIAEGQRVEKGAPLFELDSRAADVAVRYARQTVERQKQLFAAQNTSARSLQDAEAQLAAAETQRALLHITAPLAGTVTRVNVKPGEAVDLTTALAGLIDLDRLVVAVDIPAAQAGVLKPGQTVQLLTEPPVETRLVFISPEVDSTNDTVRVRAALPAGSAVRPGQFVRLRVVTATHADCLAAPAESVVTDAEGQSVIAVVKGDEAEQAPVKTGLREGGLVEIEAPGLKEGQTVVTVGAYGLPKKTKIRVVSP